MFFVRFGCFFDRGISALVREALVRGKRRIGDDRGLGKGEGWGLIDDEPWIFGCARFCGIERREMKYLSRSG